MNYAKATIFALIIFYALIPEAIAKELENPIFNMILNGKIKEVEISLKDNDSINLTDKNERSLLHYAVMSYRKDILKLLISRGANINARDIEGLTSLHYASGSGFLCMAKLLVQNGADINITDNNCMSARGLALLNDNREIVQYLDFKSQEKRDCSIQKESSAVIAQVFETPLTNEDIGLSMDISQTGELRQKLPECSIDKATKKLKEIVWRQVSNIFIAKHNLEATDSELLEFQNYHKESATSGNENKTEIDLKIEKKFQSQWIENWKVNKKLYELYGGKVAITKFGPYPFEAAQSLIRECDRQGKFFIYDKSLRNEFWALLMQKPKYVASQKQIDFTPYWKKAEKK